MSWKTDEQSTAGVTTSAIELTKLQRSHVLLVLSNAKRGSANEFLPWYRNAYLNSVAKLTGVLNVQQYERHDVDITLGQYPPLPFQYLGIYELSLDGAQEADEIIEHVMKLHQISEHAEAPATWLYYPTSEKVGRTPVVKPSMLTLAFANSVVGQDPEFREWYATRHIRHALNIPALVSGQCFGRTIFQKHGALAPNFNIVAVYEQEGSPESIIESFRSLPESTFNFPMLDIDRDRFAEWVYRPV